MKAIASGAISLCVLIGAAVPSFAGPVGVESTPVTEQQMSLSRRAVLTQLEKKQARVGRQMPEPPKGPALVRYMSERAQLEDLINRLNSGQQVNPEEIDHALR
jgi:hypothetical protein